MGYFIFKALAPIFVVLSLGYWAGKAKMVDNANVAILNVFLMDFALPSGLFLATVQTPWTGIVNQIPMALALTLSMWTTYAGVYFIATRVFHKKLGDTAVLALTASLPNYAALGLPILNGVLGATTSSSLSVAIAIACGSVLMTPVWLMILEASKTSHSKASKKSAALMLPQLMLASVKKPLVFGPILGVCGSALLAAVGLKAPDILLNVLKPLSNAALATALFLTGVILSARKLAINGIVLINVAIKNIVQPFLVWGIAVILGMDPSVTVSSILLVALSAGFFGVVFGNRYKVQSPDSESVLLISTVGGLITLPLFIMLTAPMLHR